MDYTSIRKLSSNIGRSLIPELPSPELFMDEDCCGFFEITEFMSAIGYKNAHQAVHMNAEMMLLCGLAIKLNPHDKLLPYYGRTSSRRKDRMLVPVAALSRTIGETIHGFRKSTMANFAIYAEFCANHVATDGTMMIDEDDWFPTASPKIQTETRPTLVDLLEGIDGEPVDTGEPEVGIPALEAVPSLNGEHIQYVDPIVTELRELVVAVKQLTETVANTALVLSKQSSTDYRNLKLSTVPLHHIATDDNNSTIGSKTYSLNGNYSNFHTD